ncbi:syntaxin binding protein 1, partial [Massospora cicadina]
MVSLTQIFRERFLNTVKSVTRGSGWAVVVMDTSSVKLFQLVAAREELLGLNIKAIELIDGPRARSPSDTAIYFLLPTPANVAYIDRDFASERLRMYDRAHLFFIAPIPDELFQNLSGHVMRYCESLKELFIDYIPFESKVFNLDLPNAFSFLFGRETEEEIEVIASRLRSVFLSTGEYPIIRYHNLEPRGSSISLRVAKALHKLLEQHKAENPEVGSEASMEGTLPPPRPSLIIVDRTVDLASPILHELTYQALIDDALNLKGGREYKHTFTNGLGELKEHVAILDERDPIWRELRHQHISEATEKLLKGFRALSKENAAAASLIHKDKGLVPTPAQMREIVAALPELQLKVKQYSLHIELARLSTERIVDPTVLEAEQALATGFTFESKPVENAIALVAPLLNRPDIPQESKVRLILLYLNFISRHGPPRPDVTRLIAHANLTGANLKAIVNFQTLLKYGHLTQSKKPKENEPEYKFELSRYTPEISRILTSAAQQGLCTENFPFLIQEEGVQLVSQLQANKWLRIARPTWQKKKSVAQQDKATVDADNEEAFSLSRGRIVLFIIGGLTYSEMRCARELSLASRREVVVGSTHTLTPSVFIDQLKESRYSSTYLPSGNQPVEPDARSSQPKFGGESFGANQTGRSLSSNSTFTNSSPNQSPRSSPSLPDRLKPGPQPELRSHSAESVNKLRGLHRTITKP